MRQDKVQIMFPANAAGPIQRDTLETESDRRVGAPPAFDLRSSTIGMLLCRIEIAWITSFSGVSTKSKSVGSSSGLRIC